MQTRILILSTAVIIALVCVVFTARSQAIHGELVRLDAPGPLSFTAARRVAHSAAGEALDESRAVIWATTAADHVQALATHQTILDRPRRGVMVDRLRSDESLQHFRRRWHLRQREFTALNPDLDQNDVGPETDLIVWRFDPERPPRSLYRPNRGRLQNGELMPEGNGWIVRDIHQSYGVEQTIDGIIHGIRMAMAIHPKGQDMLVSDLSMRGGGRFRPHLSHQSGRDVDLTYYRYTNEEPTFSRTRIPELDVHRTWILVRTLATDHDLEYIFMNQPHQVALYEYAEAIGEHPAFLDDLFQHGPRRHRNSRAPVRYSRGHHDHMHIRFHCSDDDIRCRAAR